MEVRDKYTGYWKKYYMGKWAYRIGYFLMILNIFIDLFGSIALNQNEEFNGMSILITGIIVHVLVVALELVFCAPILISEILDLIYNSSGKVVVNFIIQVMYFGCSFMLLLLLLV